MSRRRSDPSETFYHSSKPVLAVLVFVDTYADRLYWEFQLENSSQFELLRIEIAHYNNWISLLKSGLAPYESYSKENYGDATLEIPDEIYLAQNRGYNRRDSFERPSARYAYMMHEGYQGFELYNLSRSGFHPKDEEDDEETKDELWTGSYRERLKDVDVKTLREIITDKYSLYDSFGMGYRILPMTARLINNPQKYQPAQEILKRVFDPNGEIQRNLAERLAQLSTNESEESEEVESSSESD